jgi:hypothetical protein
MSAILRTSTVSLKKEMKAMKKIEKRRLSPRSWRESPERKRTIHRRWTTEEDEQLRKEVASDMSWPKIAAAHGRSYDSVQQHAYVIRAILPKEQTGTRIGRPRKKAAIQGEAGGQGSGT